MTRSDRAKQLVEVLPGIYPEAHCELDFKTPLQLLIATILSAQCTDTGVTVVTPALFGRLRTAGVSAAAPPAEL